MRKEEEKLQLSVSYLFHDNQDTILYSGFRNISNGKRI